MTYFTLYAHLAHPIGSFDPDEELQSPSSLDQSQTNILKEM